MAAAFGGQPSCQQVKAIDRFFHQIERNERVLVGRLESNPRVAALDFVKLPCQTELGVQDLLRLPKRAAGAILATAMLPATREVF